MDLTPTPQAEPSTSVPLKRRPQARMVQTQDGKQYIQNAKGQLRRINPDGSYYLRPGKAGRKQLRRDRKGKV